MIKESFFDSAGVRLHYLDWGGLGQPLVLLAGLGGTAQWYRGLAPKLTADYRILALTRRGHGRSERPNSGYELPDLVEDIRRFLDVMHIEKAVLAGHSFAGIELPHFARRYPERVAGLVFFDALFPHLDPEPDFSDDPVWSIPVPEPNAADLASPEAYLAYHRRNRPDIARVWGAAVEADLLDKFLIQDDGRIVSLHDDALMNRIASDVWPIRDPQYENVRAPMLAIVPDGNYHHGLAPDAPEQQRQAADQYWRERIRPWIRQRTAAFRQCAPSAQIIELDSPNHLIFIVEEEATVAAVRQFEPTAAQLRQ